MRDVELALLRRLPDRIGGGKLAASGNLGLLLAALSALARDKFDGYLPDLAWRLVFFLFAIAAVALMILRSRRAETREDFVQGFTAELAPPRSLPILQQLADREEAEP